MEDKKEEMSKGQVAAIGAVVGLLAVLIFAVIASANITRNNTTSNPNWDGNYQPMPVLKCWTSGPGYVYLVLNGKPSPAAKVAKFTQCSWLDNVYNSEGFTTVKINGVTNTIYAPYGYNINTFPDGSQSLQFLSNEEQFLFSKTPLKFRK